MVRSTKQYEAVMDISKIRSLLGECYATPDDPRALPAEQDYIEAQQTLRALKSLFQQSLPAPHAATGTGTDTDAIAPLPRKA